MRLLISTGEVSGDLQGSFLVKALIEEASLNSFPLEIIAIGGSRMKKAGAKLIADTTSIGAIGFWEAIPYLLPTFQAQSTIDNLLKTNPPDAIILIDYMGPNIRLGNKARKLLPKIPIIYYIAPQEWAWSLGEGGTTDLINFTDKILAIFKEEAKFYSSKGGNVKWVGHPMLDTKRNLLERKKACSLLGIDPSNKMVLMFPASRSQELKYLLPTLAKAANLIQKNDPSIYFLVPSGLEGFENKIREELDRNNVLAKVIPALEVDRLKTSLFSVAELAIGKSGTINMELALHFIPQIAAYKVSRITAFIAKKILKFNVDHISPVNLLLKERLIPELVQNDLNENKIAEMALSLLEDSNLRSIMIKGYERLSLELGEAGVTSRAAKEIISLILK